MFALIDEAVMVELTVKVLTAIAFVMTVDADIVEFNKSVLPVIVEKRIWLVDMMFVLIDEAVMVELTIIVFIVIALVMTDGAVMLEFSTIVLPVIVEKRI